MFHRNTMLGALAATLAVAALLAPFLPAQETPPPQVTSVEPTSGRVNDSITLSGKNLGEDNVTGAFLSDATIDYKATVIEQTNEKIVMRVPQVRPGDYNISVQVSNTVLILPYRFRVEP